MTEERALVPKGIVLPLVTVEEAVQGWKGYLKLCEALLDTSDYATIQGRKFRKKSGWRKLAHAFNVSDTILEKVIRLDDRGRVISAELTVEAIAPNSRSAVGWGSCSVEERAHEEDKKTKTGICKGPCDGRKHYSNPSHDIPATAHTRAKNRAISDLIGAGEVSAEEVEAANYIDGEYREVKKPSGKKPHKKKSPKKSQEELREELADMRPEVEQFAKETGAEITTHELDPKDVADVPEPKGWGWLRKRLADHDLTVENAQKILMGEKGGVEDWLQLNPGKGVRDALDEVLAVSGIEKKAEEAAT